MDKALEVKNLSKTYKNGRGMKDITFTVNRGEVYGILGPNGAGKTTLMKTITGLCRADQGEVKIFGFDINNQFEEAMAQVGCIIESPAAYQYLSARRNLELLAYFYKDLKASRIDEVLTMVGLSTFENDLVGKYSTGMKQRLGLAQALLSSPELLILDEPTNGLDIEGMAEVRNLILQLAREQHLTFFVSSHLAHEMELTCQRVLLINNGHPIIEGTMSEILSSHTSLEDFFIQQVQDDRRKLANG